MPCMKSKRYSHMGAFFKTGRLGYIYIFGGRDEEDQLLASCEQFSIEESNIIFIQKNGEICHQCALLDRPASLLSLKAKSMSSEGTPRRRSDQRPLKCSILPKITGKL